MHYFIVKAPAISVLFFMIGTRYTFSLIEEVLSEAVSSMKLSQNERKRFSLSFLEEIRLKTRKNVDR